MQLKLNKYYYPVFEQPSNNLVYMFESLNDTLVPNEKWSYEGINKDGKLFQRTLNYDSQGRPSQVNLEEIVPSGVILRELLLLDYDSTGLADTISAEIKGNNVFPFEVADSSQVFYYKVSWWQANPDSTEITLTRNRRYLGKRKFMFKGKAYDCVRFQLRELLVTEAEGQTRTQWSGEEWYAKGLGLVYYKKDITPTLRIEYRLVNSSATELK